MQNRIGTVVPQQSEVQARLQEVQELKDRLKAYTVMLSREERQATTKFRTGGEKIVGLLAELAAQHQVSLPGIAVDQMRADLELAQRLQPLAAAVETLGQTLADSILEAQSECWWAATAYYTALTRIAGTDPALENALRPAVDFFATGRRRNKE